MIADADVIAELKTLQEWRYAFGPTREAPYDYRILDVRALPNVADFEVRERDGLAARIQVSLPSSSEPQYWLYCEPENASEWMSQFLTWLDEEVFTLGLGESRARIEHNGASYVIVESYGWRVNDPQEHARLKAVAGDSGRDVQATSTSPRQEGTQNQDRVDG